MKINDDPFFGPCVTLEAGGIRARIAPRLGMALVDFSVEGVSLLDLSRRDIFLQYRKGLGPLILPHFNQRREFPNIDTTRFPHARYLNANGLRDPFQHGVGRYAEWKFEGSGEGVQGKIDGQDTLADVPLREITGFDFSAAVTYSLDRKGLSIAFDLNARQPVEAGIHFYYDAVNPSTASVTLAVEEAPQLLVLPLDQAYDTVFHPRKEKSETAEYLLRTERYELLTLVKIQGAPEETFDSVTVFHPQDSGFVCVEPLSSSPLRGNAKTRFRGVLQLFPKALAP